MRIFTILASTIVHLLAAIAITVAGVWYGVVTYGMTTPQFIYNLIAWGVPIPALGLGFLLTFAVCTLVAQLVVKTPKTHVSENKGTKPGLYRRAGFWLMYLLGSSTMYMAGVWLTTLNPMIDVPAPVADLVINGTPIALISLIVYLFGAGLIGLANSRLSAKLS